MRQIAWEENRARERGASNYLAGGAVVHALSIPIGLILLKALVESVARRSVSWGELFGAMQQTGVMGLIVSGVLGQGVFVILASLGAFLFRFSRPQAAIPMIIVGVIGVIFSFAVFGGIFGAIGGGLVAAGGAKGRARPPAPWVYPPTSYVPPMYGPPPLQP